MTRETDVRAMPAGRELEAMVAECVMGWEYFGQQSMGPPIFRIPSPAGFRTSDSPSFSEEIAAAWVVVEAMRAKGYGFEIWARDSEDIPLQNGEAWAAEFTLPGGFLTDRRWKGSADSAPLAICRAALLATEPPHTQSEP